MFAPDKVPVESKEMGVKVELPLQDEEHVKANNTDNQHRRPDCASHREEAGKVIDAKMGPRTFDSIGLTRPSQKPLPLYTPAPRSSGGSSLTPFKHNDGNSCVSVE
jgi:hypothetical protein